MSHPFLKTLTHPRKIALATALLGGASHASLVPEYGKARVQDMAMRIKFFDVNNPKKALPCLHCFSGLCMIK